MKNIWHRVCIVTSLLQPMDVVETCLEIIVFFLNVYKKIMPSCFTATWVLFNICWMQEHYNFVRISRDDSQSFENVWTNVLDHANKRFYDYDLGNSCSGLRTQTGCRLPFTDIPIKLTRQVEWLGTASRSDGYNKSNVFDFSRDNIRTLSKVQIIRKQKI